MDDTPNKSPISLAECEKLMRRASGCSLFVGVFLVTIKTAAWLYTDSLSLMASLADSLLDVIASAINFIAVRYALQPPDKEHRFGHGKAEDLATLAQSTFICGSGVFLIIVGIKRLFAPAVVYNGSIGLGVMGISIFCTIILVLYQRHVVRKTSSSIIAADAMHYFTDFLTNLGVIIALIFTTELHWKLADPILALLIAGYIIYGAFSIASTALQNLMDREFLDEEREKIKAIVRDHEGVAGLHELRTRRSGIYGFIQFHMDFNDKHISLKEAHHITDNVEKSLMNAFPNTEVLIHQDPAD